MKLTNEQVSKVISEHVAGNLRGYKNWTGLGYKCIVEVVWGLDAFTAYCRHPDMTNWFDENYNRSWTPEEFLANLAEFEGKNDKLQK